MKCLTVVALSGLFVACSPNDDDEASFQFIDESAQRGLDYSYISGSTEDRRLPEIMGGGVALFDSDLDGDIDAYFIQSGQVDTRSPSYANVLFLNNGLGEFKLHNAAAASLDLGYSMGVAIGDVNQDALPDIFVTQLGKNKLLINEGLNQYRDATAEAGFLQSDWSTATAFADFDLDGDLDLWVVNYIEWSTALKPECYQTMLGSRDYCSPLHFEAPAQDRVFRNLGDGRFAEVTDESGVFGTKGNGLGIVTADFNGDNLIDVFVANDTSPNHLWLNQGNFQFENRAAIWNCAVDQHGDARAGMGIVATDIDDDSDQDVIVVHITTQSDYVFSNEGDYFRDVAPQVGMSIHSQRYTRFGLVVNDLNNDGWLDIFEANGAVSRLSKPHNGDQFAEPNSLYAGNADGKFEMINYDGGIFTSRAAAVGDVNNDGTLEIVVVDRDATVKLLVNHSQRLGNWILLNLRDTYNRPALGAKVSLNIGDRTVTRVVQQASSYLASNDPRLHFGLGGNPGVSNVRIRWLSGAEKQIDWLDAGQIATIVEDKS
ncbi:MAG: CRTAC1 family protein [Gammaproteobacteria bacterium]|nr:CRTAC1 family protein [Gammaproteobacteria bacterium]